MKIGDLAEHYSEPRWIGGLLWCMNHQPFANYPKRGEFSETTDG